MVQFEYVAKNKNGSTIKGKEVASSRDEALTKLMRRNLVVVSIEESHEEKKVVFPSTVRGGRVGTFELIVFCKQLATMVKGGIPLLRSIDAIALEVKNRAFKKVLMETSNYVREGMHLSDTMKKYPHMFSYLFVAMVESGEKVGALDTMLERMARYLEARDRINKKIISAIMYPAFIIGFFIFVVTVITLFIVPRFKAMYQSFGAKLPALTVTVFNISDIFVHNIVFILAISIIAIFLFYQLVLKNKTRRYLFDKMVLNLFIFGNVIKKASLSKFNRTLATLLEQGISITESLELVGRTAGNLVVEKVSLTASKSILDGETIPQAFKKAGIFPPLMLQMVTIGVEAGTLPAVLDKTADFYEDEVDVFISIMTSLIEPVLIIIIGGILAFVILALYMPIFKLGQAISGGI